MHSRVLTVSVSLGIRLNVWEAILPALALASLVISGCADLLTLRQEGTGIMRTCELVSWVDV